jgi:hypothetical protein
MFDERVAHIGELPQVPVVRQDDAGAREVERVQIRVGDDGLRGSSGRSDVGSHAFRPKPARLRNVFIIRGL